MNVTGFRLHKFAGGSSIVQRKSRTRIALNSAKAFQEIELFDPESVFEVFQFSGVFPSFFGVSFMNFAPMLSNLRG